MPGMERGSVSPARLGFFLQAAMDATRILSAARTFQNTWRARPGREISEYQPFWNSLLREVLGVADVEARIQYQVPVQKENATKSIDAWIPETRVLIEHKSRGIRLDAPQSGHGGQTPYGQALEYNQLRRFSEKARWIVTCNFDEFWVYDMDNPRAKPQKIFLKDLERETARLAFLVDPAVTEVRSKEERISEEAGRLVAALYAELLKRFAAPTQDALAALNRLCVRLVFCFYAEDAGLFPKDAFWKFLGATPASHLRGRLYALFKALDTPREARIGVDEDVAAFPYVNGGLFARAEQDDIPAFDEAMKGLLRASADFDWRDISPTIFGALFESTLNPETRRAGGMVYTSVENIHKVIDPLFLDDLTLRAEALLAEAEAKSARDPSKPAALSKRQRADLRALQDELAALVFLDPACGSGNFLTETYLSLRRLENRLIKALQSGEQGELDVGTVKVGIWQFHGIEINDFAVAVAKTAMWISEAKMLGETADLLDARNAPDYLPLRDYDGILERNALRMEWPKADYIMGNPPFSGARWMGKSQKEDMLAVFGKKWPGVGDLDYVTAWYKKAAGLPSRCAFVSTNSICQGGSVANLWKPLMAQGLEIDFAWRTFRWDSAAVEKAHVHCVIVGFHGSAAQSAKPAKRIYDGGTVIEASHINGYLMDAPDIFIEPRSKPLCDVPKIGIGNKPIDGGNYLFSKEEMAVFLKNEPQAERYFHPWYGADEFLHGKPRYCLWLGDCAPSELFAMPACLKRVEAVRAYRLASKSPGTRKIASKPTRFHVENMPKGHYVVIPEVSSERRRYVPMGFLPSEAIASNLVHIVPNAGLHHFGVLTSSAHMAWMRAVAGRLKSDYRYSAKIVYNNFPWPDKPLALVGQTAQAILDARAKYPGMTLAQMYGETMYLFPELVAAHEANDRAVLAAYGLDPGTPEPEIVDHLFRRYGELVRSAR